MMLSVFIMVLQLGLLRLEIALLQQNAVST
jgi:hypothetical protein